MRSFSELKIILFITATAICAGCETRCGNDDMRDAGENAATAEPRLADNMVNAAWILDLRPVRTGVWLADPDLPFLLKKRPYFRIEVPIEVIADPKVADLVHRGFRPDGKIMYRYPEELSSEYPPEFLDYAIDIFPEKAPEGQGVDKGHLILYGHILKPPYSAQVVVVDEKDIRVLVNGIEMGLPSPRDVRKKQSEEERKRERKGEKKKTKIQERNPRLKYFRDHWDKTAKLMGDALCRLHGYPNYREMAISEVIKVLRKDPRVKNIRITTLGSINPMIAYELNYYPDLGEDPPPRPILIDSDGTMCRVPPKSHEVYKPPSFADEVRWKILDAYDVLVSLSRDNTRLYFYVGSTGMSWQDFDALQSYCKTSPKPDVYIKQMSKIVHGHDNAILVLANCTRDN